MPIILLRQSSGNTEPRSANVSVKGSPLLDSELDNNFNNLNNSIEYNSGIIQLAYSQANTAFANSNTKFSSTGGTVSGDILVYGQIVANNYTGNIDAGNF